MGASGPCLALKKGGSFNRQNSRKKKRRMLSNNRKCELLFVTAGKKNVRTGILKAIGTETTTKLCRNAVMHCRFC